MPELRVVVSARWQQPVELLLNSPQPRVPAPASDDPPACLPSVQLLTQARLLLDPLCRLPCPARREPVTETRTEEVTTHRTLFKADMEASKAYFLRVVAETIDASGGWMAAWGVQERGVACGVRAGRRAGRRFSTSSQALGPFQKVGSTGWTLQAQKYSPLL